MYNVVLLDRCNLHCNYCFAQDYMRVRSGQKRDEVNRAAIITIPDFDRLLDFLKQSEVTIVSLIGGEPTLHPDFSTLVEMALGKDFLVSIKSNATWMAKTQKEILGFPTSGVHFLLNINSPQALGARLWRRVVENVMGLNGRRVDFQLNIDRPDFEYEHLLKLARKFRPQRIIWSLSNLVKGDGNHPQFNPLFVRQVYSKRILSFIADAGLEGLPTIGVHGVTPCMFSEQDYQTVLANGGRLESTCRPVFDILPDLSIYFCFPLGEYFGRKQLCQYTNLQALNMEFMESLAFLRSDSYPLAECLDCSYASTQACHGGCLARHLDKNNLSTDPERNFFDRIPIQTGNFQVNKVFTSNDNKPSASSFLVDVDSGKQYPIDPALAILFEAVDGLTSLDSIYRNVFHENTTEKVTRMIFKEVVTQLLKREILALKPFMYSNN